MDNKELQNNDSVVGEQSRTQRFVADLKRRIKENKKTRWLRFGLVSLIFVLWVAWLGNWWVLLVWPLLFDIYITGYIPFTWWKKSENKFTRKIMSWVDAIVYALILVYFVFTFIGQNYQIPSSSLEKSLLVGDYLWVNKMAYGPRVPNTPLHFPLVQHTLPVLETKSYIEWPQWKYHRLKGFGSVQRNDIVVFNVPAGDTVALKKQNEGTYYDLIDRFGYAAVHNNKEVFGDIIYRPVDRRENYVKRALGLPGETFEIVDDVVKINGKAIEQPEYAQFLYTFQMKGKGYISDEEWDNLGVNTVDHDMLGVTNDNVSAFQQLGFDVTKPIYTAFLTDGMKKTLADRIEVLYKNPVSTDEPVFPASKRGIWTHRNYGPIWIPKKGATIDLTKENWDIYNRAIRNYEFHHDAYWDDNKGYAVIDGKRADKYTFMMDYYFMVGDNRDNSLDSRFWGFVPEDHIVGRPELILISFDQEHGGVRTDRIFRRPNPQK